MKIFCWVLFGLFCVVIVGQMMRTKTPQEKLMDADRQNIKDCEYVMGGSGCLALRLDFYKKYGMKP